MVEENRTKASRSRSRVSWWSSHAPPIFGLDVRGQMEHPAQRPARRPEPLDEPAHRFPVGHVGLDHVHRGAEGLDLLYRFDPLRGLLVLRGPRIRELG